MMNGPWSALSPSTKKQKKIRPVIIANQHTETMTYLNQFHPLRIMNYIRGDYRAYDMFDAEELCDYIDHKMVKQYRQLFYHCRTNREAICEDGVRAKRERSPMVINESKEMNKVAPDVIQYCKVALGCPLI